MARDRERHASVKVVPPPAWATQTAVGRISTLKRLEAALMTVAVLVIRDPVYTPIFERLEREIEAERNAQSDNILNRARAIVAQKEMGAKSVADISSDAPFP